MHFINQARRVGVLSTLLLLLVLGGCSKQDSSGASNSTQKARAKLDRVFPFMIRLSQDEAEASRLRLAEPFVTIKGLDMPIAGFSVPIGTNGNRAHVSFTIDHLLKTEAEVLAKEALDDLRMATQRFDNKAGG